MVFAGLATLRHIARTDWIGVFYYNADSLVLPLVERSIHHGEAFQWVFSSQNFFFPEGAFFFLSTLFTDNPRVALSINAVLNLVALYALLRVIAHVLSRHSRHRLLEICIALGAALLFVVFVLLEPIASPNGSGIATPFLFTTYYYGVVLGGLGMLALVLWVTNAFSGHSIERRKKIIFLGAAALLTALVTFSNPLYIFQVIAPLWVTLLILIFMTRVGWRFFLQTIAATGGAVIVAFGIRALMPQLFAAGVSRYVAISNIPMSIENIYLTFKELLSTPQGALKLLIIGLILLVNFALLIFALYGQARPKLRTRISTAEVFIVTFVSVSTVSLAVGQVLTGSLTNRYLEPTFIFPLVTVLAIGVYTLRRMLLEVRRVELRRSLSRFAVGIAGGVSVVIVLAGSLSIPIVADANRSDNYTASSCLEKFVGTSGVNGVGTFWTTRPFELYGNLSGRFLQVKPDMTIFEWMNNRAAYANKDFSYVVYDGSGVFTRDDITRTLGQPKNVVTCDGYEIYNYAGMAGEKTLTDTIDRSLQASLGQH